MKPHIVLHPNDITLSLVITVSPFGHIQFFTNDSERTHKSQHPQNQLCLIPESVGVSHIKESEITKENQRSPESCRLWNPRLQETYLSKPYSKTFCDCVCWNYLMYHH